MRIEDGNQQESTGQTGIGKVESLPVGREYGIPITKRSRMASLDGRSQETGQSKHEVNGQVTDEGVRTERLADYSVS